MLIVKRPEQIKEASAGDRSSDAENLDIFNTALLCYVGSCVGGPLLPCLSVGSSFRYTYRSQFLAVVEKFQGATRAGGSVVGHFS